MEFLLIIAIAVLCCKKIYIYIYIYSGKTRYFFNANWEESVSYICIKRNIDFEKQHLSK